MASSFRLKRKLYSSDKEGSSFGKTALAVGGTLAATAGAFYGARKGMFGAGAQKWAGNAWAKAGKSIGSKSMVKSGAADVGMAQAKQASAAAVKEGGSAFTAKQMNKAAKANARDYIKTLNTPPTPAPATT